MHLTVCAQRPRVAEDLAADLAADPVGLCVRGDMDAQGTLRGERSAAHVTGERLSRMFCPDVAIQANAAGEKLGTDGACHRTLLAVSSRMSVQLAQTCKSFTAYTTTKSLRMRFNVNF